MDSDRKDMRLSLVMMRVRRIYCPKKCGWFRDYTDSPAWMADVIYHPLYGLIRQQDLLHIDLRTHNCFEAYNALMRIRKSRHDK